MSATEVRTTRSLPARGGVAAVSADAVVGVADGFQLFENSNSRLSSSFSLRFLPERGHPCPPEHEVRRPKLPPYEDGVTDGVLLCLKSFSKFVKNCQKRPITLTVAASYIFHTPPEKCLNNVRQRFCAKLARPTLSVSLTPTGSATSLTQNTLGQAWDKLGTSLGQTKKAVTSHDGVSKITCRIYLIFYGTDKDGSSAEPSRFGTVGYPDIDPSALDASAGVRNRVLARIRSSTQEHPASEP
jgi:hypothetical protein